MNTENTKHTPGPWRIDSKTRFGDYTIGAGDSVKTCEFIAKTQNEANARLISAAPELLDALKEALSNLEFLGLRDNKLPGMMQRINYAIAKAEGRA